MFLQNLIIVILPVQSWRAEFQKIRFSKVLQNGVSFIVLDISLSVIFQFDFFDIFLFRYVLEQLSYISGIRQRSQNSDSSKITLATSTEQNIGLTNTAFFNDINQDSKDTNRRREDIFHELSRVTKTTNDKVDDIIRTLRRKDAEKLYKEEWRIVAKTIDRCLFVLFSVIFVVTTVGTFSITTYVT